MPAPCWMPIDTNFAPRGLSSGGFHVHSGTAGPWTENSRKVPRAGTSSGSTSGCRLIHPLCLSMNSSMTATTASRSLTANSSTAGSRTTPRRVGAVPLTISTPLGPFTLLVDGAGAVMASGWTTDTGGLAALIKPSLRDEISEDGDDRTGGQAAAAVAAYFDGDALAN